MGIQVELEQPSHLKVPIPLRKQPQKHWIIQAEAALEAFLGSGGHTPPQKLQTSQRQA